MPTTAPQTAVSAVVTPPAVQPPATPAAPASTTGTPADGQSDTTDAGRRKDPAAEAAGRRRELRDVEGQRDALTAQLTTARRGMIEALLGSTTDVRGDGSNAPTLHRTADLWDYFNAQPDQFFTDEGTLDTAALADFIAASTADRPHMLKSVLPPRRNPAAEALNRQSGPTPVTTSTSWQRALRGTT